MADDQTDDQGQPDGGGNDDNLKALRAKAKNADRFESELNDLKAKLAERDKADLFAKVGVPDQGAGKLFRDAYKGELTEDAVRAAALEYQVIKPPEPATPPAEREAFDRIGEALHGEKPQDFGGNVLAQATAELNQSDGSVESINAILDKYGLSAQLPR